jgi:hypothetical protein
VTLGDAGAAAPREIAPATPAPLAPGSLLLASGGSPDDDAFAGRQIAAGDEIAAANGRAVLALPTGITLMMEHGTALRVERLDSQAVELALDRGQILASVSPGRQGPRLGVATAAGRVVVTGTVFEVAAAAGDVAVRVLRGVVHLERDGLAPRSLEASREAVLGRPGERAIEPGVQALAKQKVRVLDLLAERDGARIEIQSVPSGALVALDGVDLGPTPLSISARAGHRDLDLTLAGHGPVRERLDLPPGAVVERVFEMRPLGSTVAGDAVVAAREEPLRPKAGSAGPASARDLLRQAQSQRAAKDWPGAARTYQALISRFPVTAEASTAQLSLASIELDHLGQPTGALRNYNAHLAANPGGALAPEALFGKARALRRLGRAAEETTTLRELLARFPGAINAAQARLRLDELSSTAPI